MIDVLFWLAVGLNLAFVVVNIHLSLRWRRLNAEVDRLIDQGNAECIRARFAADVLDAQAAGPRVRLATRKIRMVPFAGSGN